MAHAEDTTTTSPPLTREESLPESQVLVKKILNNLDAIELIKEPRFVFNDLLIPYRGEQLCINNDDGDATFVNDFLEHQKWYLGQDDNTKHYRMEDNGSRYVYKAEAGRSGGRTTVDVVAVKTRNASPPLATQYARKVVEKPSARQPETQRNSLLQDFWSEIACLKKCREKGSHRHVVEFKESYTDENTLGILMLPVGNMNLKDFMTEPESETRSMGIYAKTAFHQHISGFFGCLANAMAWLTDIQIRHRDVKPENILIILRENETPGVVVCDFGLSKDWDEEGQDTTQSNTRGTPRYRAPELTHADPQPHNQRTDVWALGCVYVEMHTVLCDHTLEDLDEAMRNDSDNDVSRGAPSFAESRQTVLEQVEYYCKRAGKSEGTSDANARLRWIKNMLEKHSQHRPTFNELVEETNVSAPHCGPCCKKSSQSPQPCSSSAQDSKETSDEVLLLLETKKLKTIRIHKQEAGSEPSSSPLYAWERDNDFETLIVDETSVDQIQTWQIVRTLRLHGTGHRNNQDGKVFWLPHILVGVALQNAEVVLRWSDVTQPITRMPGPTGVSGNTAYDREHKPYRDNVKAELQFEDAQIAAKVAGVFGNASPSEKQKLHTVKICDGDHISHLTELTYLTWRWDEDCESASERRESGSGFFTTRESATSHGLEFVRQRRFFLPSVTDFEIFFQEAEQTKLEKITWKRVFEPRYRSNRINEFIYHEDRDIDPHSKGPSLRRSKLDLNLSHFSSESGNTNDSRWPETFDRLGRWRLVWASNLVVLMRKTKHRLSALNRFHSVTSERPLTAMFWNAPEPSGQKRLALRWQTEATPSTHNEVIWWTTDVFESEHSAPATVTLTTQGCKQGKLFDLNHASVSPQTNSGDGEGDTWELHFPLNGLAKQFANYHNS